MKRDWNSPPTVTVASVLRSAMESATWSRVGDAAARRLDLDRSPRDVRLDAGAGATTAAPAPRRRSRRASPVSEWRGQSLRPVWRIRAGSVSVHVIFHLISASDRLHRVEVTVLSVGRLAPGGLQ